MQRVPQLYYKKYSTRYKRALARVLDVETYDLNGKVNQEARIKLPNSTKQKILKLEKLYSESLNWEDPGGASMWDKSQ